MVECSVIITSCKQSVDTLSYVSSCPVSFEVVVSRKAGLGFARNWGARQAKGKLLLFLDDDLRLDPKVWDYVLGVKYGEFVMTFLAGFPCSRVVAVHRSDFWRIGGFDENIRFTGEDRDFYVRALSRNYVFKQVPLNLVFHKQHEPRSRNFLVALGSVRENVKFIVKYWRRYPKVFRVDFLERAKRGQARTLLLQFVFLLYYVLVDVKCRVKLFFRNIDLELKVNPYYG